MKKICIILMVSLMMFTLSACSGEKKLAPFDFTVSSLKNETNENLTKIKSKIMLPKADQTEVNKNGKKYAAYHFAINDPIALDISPNNDGEYTIMLSIYNNEVTSANSYETNYEFLNIAESLIEAVDPNADYDVIADAIGLGQMNSKTKSIVINGYRYSASADDYMVVFFITKN